MSATNIEIEQLRQRLRSRGWIALWALIFGLGIGVYIGFNLGVDTARHVAEAGITPGQAN